MLTESQDLSAQSLSVTTPTSVSVQPDILLALWSVSKPRQLIFSQEMSALCGTSNGFQDASQEATEKQVNIAWG